MNGQMEKCTRASTSMEKGRGVERCTTQTEKGTLEVGKMVKNTGQVSSSPKSKELRGIGIEAISLELKFDFFSFY